MNPFSRQVSVGLAYAGAIPFWIFALLPETAAGLSTASIFVAYVAMIACFMAGAHWGQLQAATRSDLGVLVASNALALISFATLMFPRPLLSIAVQLPPFLAAARCGLQNLLSKLRKALVHMVAFAGDGYCFASLRRRVSRGAFPCCNCGCV